MAAADDRSRLAKVATLQRTTTSSVGTVAQFGFLNNLLRKLRPIILRKGVEVGADYGLKAWSFGEPGISGIPINHIVLDEAKVEQVRSNSCSRVCARLTVADALPLLAARTRTARSAV